MTPQADRIASLDVLRGLGILGILAVNATFFAMPLAAMMEPEVLGPMDADSTTAWGAVRIFFERKFVTLFSMLFGASMLLVGGPDKSDPERNRFLNRRLGWLLLFGLIHGALIWYGDILLTYAIAGFITAQFRHWQPARLFAVGAGVYLLFALFEAANYWLMAFMPEAAEQGMAMFSPEAARAEVAAFQSSLAGAQMANLKNWAVLLGFSVFYIPSTIALMMVGMGLFKTGVLAARRGVGLYLVLTLLGGAALAAIGWAVLEELAAGEAKATAQAVHMTLNGLFAPVVTLGYIGLVCLILKTPLRTLTRPLAATGQMAFTNYITQSLMMTGVFWAGRGLGLFGTMSYAEQALVVMGIWVLQLIWSPIWLSFFRYGPLEWIWRRLTYAGPVAFRR